MILGVGVDIIEPERIGRAIENERFLTRVYTQGERAHIAAGGAMRHERAAGIFAAKEAVLKALGCGFDGVSFCDVEVIWEKTGQPRIALHGRAQDKFISLGGSKSHISITHIKSSAAAFAVLEGD